MDGPAHTRWFMMSANEAWKRLYTQSDERAAGAAAAGGDATGSGAAAPPSSSSGGAGGAGGGCKKKKGGGSSKKKGGKAKKPLRQFPGAPWRIGPTEGPARAAFFPPALLAAAEAADAATWVPPTAAVLYYDYETPMEGVRATLRAGGVVELCDEALSRDFNARAAAAAAEDRASLCLTATRVDELSGGRGRAVRLGLRERVAW